LARGLAQTVQNQPDLRRLINTWPTLPETIKARILGIIEGAEQSQ
jgi:hypothetical protein